MKNRLSRIVWSAFGICAVLGFSVSTSLAQIGQAPKVLDTHKSTVYCLSYGRLPSGKSVGACSSLRVTVGGAPVGTVRVGFFESEVGGSGDMWRSAGWAAATMAAQLTEFDPHAVQVAFDIKGRIDGPSAGALMTIGIVSAVRGEKVRADAAMTGTINPDGIIGPVGGIIYKIEGAAKAGKKLVVIPQGMQVEQDPHTKKWIDLVEHGKKLGVEVKPTLDIYTAYALMTGKELPRPKLYAHPSANIESEAILKRRIASWGARYKHAVKTYSELPQDSRTEASDELIAESKKSLARAEKLLPEGEVTAAYMDVVHANMYAYLAMELGRNIFEYNRRGLAGAIKRVRKNGWLEEEMRDTAELIEEFRPRTFDQLAMYFMASEAYFEAICLQKLAQDILRALPEDNEDLAGTLLLTAAQWQMAAWIDLKLTANYLSLARTYKGTPIPDDAPVGEMADFYFKAYEANVNVLDSLVIEPAAKAAGVPVSQIRNNLRFKDFSYAIMTKARRDIAPRIDTYFPNAKRRGYPYLASSLYLHLHGSMLVTKYYSLGAKLDKDLNIVGMKHERMFSDWLEWSESEARRNIGVLKARGLGTTALSHLYELAHVSRNRDLESRIRALTWFYDANVNAQVMRRLAGVSLEKKAQPASP